MQQHLVRLDDKVPRDVLTAALCLVTRNVGHHVDALQLIIFIPHLLMRNKYVQGTSSVQ